MSAGARPRRAGALLRLGVVAVLSALGAAGAVPAAADTGPWVWPLAGPQEVSRPFDPPASRYGTGHRGADLPATSRATVRAAGAGRVSYAGLLAGRGVVVVVHGQLRTTYEPVTAAVAVGELVDVGQALGALDTGHAGCPTETCLHWGLRRGDEYLDPVRLVDRGPARLLPVGPGPGGARVRAPLPGQRGAAPAPPVGAWPSSESAPALPSPQPSPGADPGWSLRAAEAPLGAAAVAALVVGIGLIARPRPDPDRPPVSGAGRAVSPELVEPYDEPSSVAPVLELEAERLRRRTAG